MPRLHGAAHCNPCGIRYCPMVGEWAEPVLVCGCAGGADAKASGAVEAEGAAAADGGKDQSKPRVLGAEELAGPVGNLMICSRWAHVR